MNQSSESASYWAKKADEVLEKLVARIPENKIRPRLEPTARAASLLGDPQRSYRVIHVTGTNGKTSTTRFIERILREHGLKTGRFTSPHLIKLNERIALDGEPVSDEQLFRIFTDIEPILEFVDEELLAQGESRLTFFEALAVLGFAVFADAPVDVLVLEVGMGGTWDSTNVADGDVAVFTPIGLDHMERLGNTISEIAETKSGIIKSGALVVSSHQEPEALDVIQRVTSERAESLKVFGQDFNFSSRELLPNGQRVSITGLADSYGLLEMPVVGQHQAENLAVAIAAVEAFLGGGTKPINFEILRSAVADLSSPGRLQLIPGDPDLLLDGAHNPAGAKVLANALRADFAQQPLVGLIALLAEKDAVGVLTELSKSFDKLIVTESSSPRAIPAAELAELCSKVGLECLAISDLDLALQAARAQAITLKGAVVVTGSISLVGDVLAKYQKDENAK